MIKVYVIAPDKSSGIAFCEVLKRDHIFAEFNYHHIRPRVINNKITKSHDVIDDLNKVFRSFNDKTKSVIIACNTLQLWLDDVDEIYKRHVKVYTTFEACEWEFRHEKIKPLWLGTTPLVEKTKNFPTLLTYGRNDIQNLVQELIWRVKMLEGDEYGTAPEIVKKDKDDVVLQRYKIQAIKNEILKCLKDLKVKKVIMGCTEIPLVFVKSNEKDISFIDPADVLADFIKAQSVAIIFAGGTISSLADDRGVRSGGKVFNLLEKLNDHLPGSYKNINISKSDIVYPGLSENMTEKDHENILKAVKKALRVGISRVVITHGTDSMEQTARFLNNMLRQTLKKNKTMVVLTGSNDHPDSGKTDAWINLRSAINESHEYHESGVFIAFHNRLVRADEVIKDFYNGVRMTYVSKNSPHYKQSVKLFNQKVSTLNMRLEEKLGKSKEVSQVLEYDVSLIRKDHKDFLNIIKDKNPKAVVFKLYHSGTANTTDPKSSVSLLVEKLTKNGVACFGATENGEPTSLNLYETSIALFGAGMIPLYDMLLPVAMHKLQLLRINSNKLNRQEIIKKMLENIAGEINTDVSSQNNK